MYKNLSPVFEEKVSLNAYISNIITMYPLLVSCKAVS